MSLTTDPTVLLPTATDTDDDDDDESSTLLPQPPAVTQQPIDTAVPGLSSVVLATATAPGADPSVSFSSTGGQVSISDVVSPSSATELADRASPTALSPVGSATDTNTSGGGGLGTGASAGLGVGVALAVCLAALGVWFLLRRRRARRNKTRCASRHSTDEERPPRPPKSVYAYRAEPAAELSGEEKPRRWSELESPTYVAEVGGGQADRAELPGSAVPARCTGKRGGERLFADAPIDGTDELDEADREAVTRKDERLFSDLPIDGDTDTSEVGKVSRLAEKEN